MKSLFDVVIRHSSLLFCAFVFLGDQSGRRPCRRRRVPVLHNEVVCYFHSRAESYHIFISLVEPLTLLRETFTCSHELSGPEKKQN
jgi:hypothetical protein